MTYVRTPGQLIRRLAIAAVAIVVLTAVAWIVAGSSLGRQVALAERERPARDAWALHALAHSPQGAATSSCDPWKLIEKAYGIRDEVESTVRGDASATGSPRDKQYFDIMLAYEDLRANKYDSDEILRANRAFEGFDAAGLFLVLNDLRDCVGVPYAPIRPANGTLGDVLTEGLAQSGALARISATRARVGREWHEPLWFEQSAGACLAIARTIAASPRMTDYWRASSLEELANDEIRKVLASRPTQSWHTAIRSALRSRPPAYDLAYYLEADRIMMLDMLSVYTTEGACRIDGPIDLLGDWIKRVAGQRFKGTYTQNRDVVNAFYDAHIAVVSQPIHTRGPHPGRLPVLMRMELYSEAAEWGSPDQVFEIIRLNAEEHEAKRRAIEIWLAIDEYRAATGDFPDSLTQAEQRFAITLPRDPWTDKPFIYRKDPSTPRGFVLYCTGPDHVDNGGAFDTLVETNPNYLNMAPGDDWAWPRPLDQNFDVDPLRGSSSEE
ncbi:MAG: hypothetical protein RBS39_08695 [Phycisphaerales bacterium]|nr:hypothetical protein [Phycisphaerales bacterium]